MSKSLERTGRTPARERLLAAAGALFYEEGFNNVGIERVIERAGVAKASLYDCFGSKEALIRAYLQSRKEARQARLTEGLAKYTTPRERLLGVFDILGQVIAEPSAPGLRFREGRRGSTVRRQRTGCLRGFAPVDARFIHRAVTGRRRHRSERACSAAGHALRRGFDLRADGSKPRGRDGGANGCRGAAGSENRGGTQRAVAQGRKVAPGVSHHAARVFPQSI